MLQLNPTEMPHSLSNSPTKTSPQTTSLQPEASTHPPPNAMQQKAVGKSSSNALQIPLKMTAKTTPVEIGTRGTVGSLILQEIEFFSQLELRSQESSHKPSQLPTDNPSTSSSTRIKLGSLPTKPKKKKKNAGSKLIPSMCNMVEVVDSNQPISKSGFSYRNLKADTKTLQT